MNAIRNFILPPAKSTLAHQVDALFWFVHISGLILTIGIIIAMVYFCVKYRRRSEDDITPIMKGNNKLEVTWSVIPLLFTFVLFGWGLHIFIEQRTVPDDAYEINVTAQQWLWRFTYSNGATSTKELHVPAGRPIKLVMKSNDVIHSLYVPDFRMKQDVIPGRYTQEWFDAPKPDTSQIFCTEYCGDGHSAMLGKVIVQTPEDFQKWLDSQANSGANTSNLPPAEWGKQLASDNACNTCHSVDGSRKTGPSWKGIFGETQQFADGTSAKVDSSYIRESILHPKKKVVKGFAPVMPTNFEQLLNDDQINALIAYIKSLK